ncbi:MAG: nitrous oxide reductase accessory protein NosL [Calditrichaceae bacterium]
MKSLKSMIVCIFLLTAIGYSQNAGAILKPDLGDKIGSCPICGMDVYEKMWTRVELSDVANSVTHACAMGCATVLMDKNKYSSAKVKDFYTGALIEINDACFVVGSNILPAYAMMPAFAFISSENAELFIAHYGGTYLTGLEMIKTATAIRMERMAEKNKQK